MPVFQVLVLLTHKQKGRVRAGNPPYILFHMVWNSYVDSVLSTLSFLLFLSKEESLLKKPLPQSHQSIFLGRWKAVFCVLEPESVCNLEIFEKSIHSKTNHEVVTL